MDLFELGFADPIILNSEILHRDFTLNKENDLQNERRIHKKYDSNRK